MARRRSKTAKDREREARLGMAAGPIYGDRRPAPYDYRRGKREIREDPSAGVYYVPVRGREFPDQGIAPSQVVEHHAHGHSDPSHHVGSCDDACRRGLYAHPHRPRRLEVR
jgi:hypothetical protein